MSHDAADRRLHPRLAVDAQAELLKAGAVFRARMLDLSMGGARVRVSGRIAECACPPPTASY